MRLTRAHQRVAFHRGRPRSKCPLRLKGKSISLDQAPNGGRDHGCVKAAGPCIFPVPRCSTGQPCGHSPRAHYRTLSVTPTEQSRATTRLSQGRTLEG